MQLKNYLRVSKRFCTVLRLANQTSTRVHHGLTLWLFAFVLVLRWHGAIMATLFFTSLCALFIANFASVNHPRNYMAVLTQFTVSFVRIVVEGFPCCKAVSVEKIVCDLFCNFMTILYEKIK